MLILICVFRVLAENNMMHQLSLPQLLFVNALDLQKNFFVCFLNENKLIKFQ